MGAAWALAGLYAAAALLVMWRAPRVPYADGWRFLGAFVRGRFPGNVFHADNGHYEVLPNAVRVLEMHLFQANQSLQVAVGIALLLASVGVGWRMLRRVPSPQARAAAGLALVIGLCWLGNVRTLGHANETVHAYAVTLFLMLGTWALVRRQPGPSAWDAVLASLCGLLAALSFGSGIAVFAGYLVVSLVRRARWQVAALLCGSSALVFLLLRAGGGGAGLPVLAPASQLDILVRWLAAPWLYAAWPAVDPAIAAQVPMPALQTLLGRVAAGWEALFGPVALSRWPHAVLSSGGVAALTWMSVACWRRPDDSPARLAGLALAWFALAVGAMVALVRAPYFDLHPNQVVATRYVVWSSLFWAGLGIALVAGAKCPSRALLSAVAMGLVLLPSQVWMAGLADRMNRAADQTALAAAVGVLDPELDMGETVPAELVAALPAVQQAGTAVFAWPEARMLGTALPGGAVAVPVQAMVIEPAANLLGEPGRRVRLRAGAADGRRLLLVDADGIVRGLAAPGATSPGEPWIGWMRGPGSGGPVRAALPPGQGASSSAAGALPKSPSASAAR